MPKSLLSTPLPNCAQLPARISLCYLPSDFEAVVVGKSFVVMGWEDRL
jgi:hypothetical protein